MDFRSFWTALFISWGFWVVSNCDQDGFLSLSCGGDLNFTDSYNISWVSDSNYVSTGNKTTIQSVETARFFADSQDRKCYRLPVKNISSLVLFRTRHVYKNYDRLNKPPVFFLSIETAIVATVNLTESDPKTEEFIWPINKGTISLCLHSITDSGYPVISSVEVRPLPKEAYKSGFGDFSNKLLRKCYRINCGYTERSLRYPLDPYDRIWDIDEKFSPVHTSAGFNIQLHSNRTNLYESPPLVVLETARVLARGNILSYDLPLDKSGDYYVVIYLAGIIPVSPRLVILINGDFVQSDYTVKRSEVNVLFFTLKQIQTMNITLKNNSFYPLVNGIEVYEMVDIPLECSSTTVSALQVIQQFAGIDLGWQEDPCSPVPWNHIGCEGSVVTSLELLDISLRSISPTFGDLLDLKTLTLHNTSLTGSIQNLRSLQELKNLNLSFNQLTSFGFDLENLNALQILDLQNNSLQGIVPDSLGELQDLRLLNVENNNLQGPLPQSLNRENLKLRTSGNLCLSFSTRSCRSILNNRSITTPQVIIPNKNKRTDHNHLATILGAVAGFLLALILISLLIFLYTRKKKSEIAHSSGSTSEMRNWIASKVFTHKEIKAATNNFKRVIGRGSFGSVYLGKLLDGKLVAVKVWFDRTQHGIDSFFNEVYLLSQIHHQNLVSLEGFCYESKQQILVFEYLPGGSLANILYGTNNKKVTLSWARRLKIAIDSAKGLDYLHNASNPRIIHRDVKCSNILLDNEMNAKVCDFGLSKQVAQRDVTHVTTVVKGTAGYLDPEYYSTQQLTEKSDVYSFGVVLLELICGREPLCHSRCPDSFNLVLWAKPYLQLGAFEIVDDRISGSFDFDSMRKTAVIACKCVERDGAIRPSIAEVLAELKEAYSIQLSYLASAGRVD